MIRFASICFAMATLAACATDTNQAAMPGFAPSDAAAAMAAGTAEEGDVDLTPTVQPRNATYTCDGGTKMMVENLQTSVRIVDTDGEQIELAAAPENQISRYGQTPNSLVLDGKDALYVKGNKPPISCQR